MRRAHFWSRGLFKAGALRGGERPLERVAEDPALAGAADRGIPPPHYLLDEDQSEDTHGPNVPGEVLELALLQEGHEPLEGDDAEDKRHDHAHQKFGGKATGISTLHGLFRVEERLFGSHALALDPLDAIEESGTAHGRDTHEEAEFAGVLAVHAHEHHGADGRTATADARNAGDALHGTGHKSAPPVHLDAFVIRMLGSSCAPLRGKQEQARKEFGDAHGTRIFEQAFESILETEANQSRRNASQDNVARFAELVRISAEATHDDVGNLLVEHHEDRQQGAGMEHDIEEHARFVHA